MAQEQQSTSLDDVKRIAWAACDTFRGVVDPSEYKDYVLVFLFLKYITDVWDEHYAEAKARYGEDDGRIRRRMERERFFLPKGASFDDLFAKRGADNVGELINIALDEIEEANKAKLEGVFRGLDFNSETKLGTTRDRNRRLKNLLEDFAKLDLGPSRISEDIIGEAYIFLIERFASDAGKKAGEFYTPRQVSRILARLVSPMDGDRIYDPACGSGSLLIEAAKQVGSKNFALYGQEVNSGTRALARMNCFLHGLDGAQIAWGDTLNDPKMIEADQLQRFDVVVANPPFSLDKWGAENAENDKYGRFFRGVPPKSKGDYAFISHMIESAQPREGRVAVVVPHGVLFRGGAEGRIRQKLIEENLLDAVIGLPANLFQSTTIPVAILVFDKRRETGGEFESRSDVIFIDASRDFAAGKTQNLLTDAHIDGIVRATVTRQNIKKYASLVTREELAQNNFNLNIPRYVDVFEAELQIDVSAVQRDIVKLEEELFEIKQKMSGCLRELGIDAQIS
jgi:type I restriction enzyme M protein